MNTMVTLPAGEMIESVITRGDLSKLTPNERTQYYVELCRSMGLNPHTQPFAYINLSGKLTLYAKRDAADQLRKINGISIEIVERSVEDGLFTVHVRAQDAAGRRDEDFGVVPLPDTMKGEARANQILKGITKAKRRVTLSISGLGFLDETEVEDIPKQTARARNVEIAKIEDPDERRAAAEAAADEWADRNAASMRRGMAAARQNAPVEHDADGVIIEQPERREDGSHVWAVSQPARSAGHDADGVIWDDAGERPATAADEVADDGLDIPAALDRRAKPNALTGSLKASYILECREYIRKATDAKVLHAWWMADQQKAARRDFELTDQELNPLKEFCIARIRALNNGTVSA